MNDLTIGRQAETITVTREVAAYYWRCEQCGWLGTGHYSLDAAMREAGPHMHDSHGLRDAEVKRVDWGGPSAYEAPPGGVLSQPEDTQP